MFTDDSNRPFGKNLIFTGSVGSKIDAIVQWCSIDLGTIVLSCWNWLAPFFNNCSSSFWASILIDLGTTMTPRIRLVDTIFNPQIDLRRFDTVVQEAFWIRSGRDLRPQNCPKLNSHLFLKGCWQMLSNLGSVPKRLLDDSGWISCSANAVFTNFVKGCWGYAMAWIISYDLSTWKKSFCESTCAHNS